MHRDSRQTKTMQLVSAVVCTRRSSDTESESGTNVDPQTALESLRASPNSLKGAKILESELNRCRNAVAG